MITHLFYHQETVGEKCAANSWASIVNWIDKEDEVIILDLGDTLNNLSFASKAKFLRIEKIRTDIPSERSYTYGLNMMMPTARGEWICLWRSDYIYCQNYYTAVQAGMKKASAVLPYEAFIGSYYCDAEWCRRHLKSLTTDERFLLKNSSVCPIYEMMDFAHFAIRKELWIQARGMDKRLWGYGWQFPELFWRMQKEPSYSCSIQYEMAAFHQNHRGSFSHGANTIEKKKELAEGEEKLVQVFGSQEAADAFKRSIRLSPLRARRPEKHYRARQSPALVLTATLKRALRKFR